ncbi:MAG: type IX secretion system sortase PorU [Bacteroidales bacterium]|jgi:hypothetical protein|nr:type IX secretion system sortase PorU [Bacteroidales bacterium]
MKTIKKITIFCVIAFFAQAAWAQSVLQHGEWAKVQVGESGVYKISYEDLVAMGFSQLQSLQIFGNGVGELPLLNAETLPKTLHEIAIYTSNAPGTRFSSGDYVLFYADVPRNWQWNETKKKIDYALNSYSTHNYYFVRVNAGEEPLRIQQKPAETAAVTKTITSFDNVLTYEKDVENVIQSGRLWLETMSEKTLSFTLPNVVETEPVTTKIQVAARHAKTAAFDVAVNGQARKQILVQANNSDQYARLYESEDNFLLKGNTLSVKITAKFDGVDSKRYLDYCLVHFRSKLAFSQEQLVFRNYSQTALLAVGQYEIETPAPVQVWNVSNPEVPQVMNVSYSGGKVRFADDISRSGEYVVFAQNFKTPTFQKKLHNRDILAYTTANMIIVSAETLRGEAQKIADLHARQKALRVAIVNQQEIFDEFSGGRPDPAALRNYFTYLWRSGGNLQYVLFFGGADYDNRNVKETQIPIICYESKESLNSLQTLVSDDFFGILQAGKGVNSNDDMVGDMDIAVGRMPVNTLADAKIAVQKLVNYCTAPQNRGEWQNYITLLADDADAGQTMHARQADDLAKQIATKYPQFNFEKIFLDAYKQVSNSSGQRYPDASRAVNERMIKGTLVFNYTGHGHYTRLAQEYALTTAMVELWKNSEKLPLVITAACGIAPYDNPKINSLGEKLFLQKDGGAIALFSTTRTVYSNLNEMLNAKIYEYLFERNDAGEQLTIGESLRKAKNSLGQSDLNKRKFALLGDPAMLLAIPQQTVTLDSIDTYAIDDYDRPLQANQKVRLGGSVRGYNNEILSDYNGELLITIFDKPQMVETLANDGSDKIKFEVQKNILFRGWATVVNGRFDAQVIVPQDISYTAGRGKINFFANSGSVQAAGSYFIAINGSAENEEKDETPPRVELFLNSYNFVQGGVTNENPLLLVKLSDDKSGINISDIAIGHNIVLIIDGDERNPIVLNDSYVADRDSYTSGTLRYQLLQLSEGEHTIVLRVWDTQNNVREEMLTFSVAHSHNLSLGRVLAYPNPVSGSVLTISFEHNQANEDLQVSLLVYDMMGNQVAFVQQTMKAQAKNSLQWNCQTTNGARLREGIYNCVLRIHSPRGMQQVSLQKIVVQ